MPITASGLKTATTVNARAPPTPKSRLMPRTCRIPARSRQPRKLGCEDRRSADDAEQQQVEQEEELVRQPDRRHLRLAQLSDQDIGGIQQRERQLLNRDGQGDLEQGGEKLPVAEESQLFSSRATQQPQARRTAVATRCRQRSSATRDRPRGGSADLTGFRNLSGLDRHRHRLPLVVVGNHHARLPASSG